jgi:hypothetical protein
MGNGYPVAAVIARQELFDRLKAETKVFSTFGGNPVAALAALAVLDVIEDERLIENAKRVGEDRSSSRPSMRSSSPTCWRPPWPVRSSRREDVQGFFFVSSRSSAATSPRARHALHRDARVPARH